VIVRDVLYPALLVLRERDGSGVEEVSTGAVAAAANLRADVDGEKEKM
jgi:hypothetical protein